MNNTSCYFCGEPDQLEQHHIVPRRFDGSDNDENLVHVCPTCHEKLESLYDKRFYDALGVTKPDTDDSDIYGWCAHEDCYAEATHKVTGSTTYGLCEAHYTCDYSTCEEEPVETRPTPEGMNDGCLCEQHRKCTYKDCQSKKTGLHIIKAEYGGKYEKMRCRHHALDETTTFTVEEFSRPDWGERR